MANATTKVVGRRLLCFGKDFARTDLSITWGATRPTPPTPGRRGG